MIIIDYGQQNFILTRWTDCWDRQSEVRYWFNQEKRIPASVVIPMKGYWSAVIYLPDGEVFDIITTKQKKQTKKMVATILEGFVRMCSCTLIRSSKEFREWLDL